MNTCIWRTYFEDNREQRPDIPWGLPPGIEPSIRAALVRSLQKFQVGETGEGKHLKACSREVGDPDYEASITLFIDEEKEHARLLAAMLQRLDAPLIHGHWSDWCFILLRRASGLKTELLILLCAEIVAQRYYPLVRDATPDPALRAMCQSIICDEGGHVAFHCDFLHETFAEASPIYRAFVRTTWKTAFRLIAFLVAHDHRGLLRACHVTSRDFRHDCLLLWQRAADAIFAPQPAPHRVTMIETPTHL